MLLARITQERELVGKCQIPQNNRFIVPLYLFERNLAIGNPFSINPDNLKMTVATFQISMKFLEKLQKNVGKLQFFKKRNKRAKQSVRNYNLLKWTQKEC